MKKREFIKTGVKGIDDMFKKGIPKGSSILVSGGCGTGKTIFCLQTLYYGLMNNEKCLYLSFGDSEERLKEYMWDFGWDPGKFEESGKLIIKKFSPLSIYRIFKEMLDRAREIPIYPKNIGAPMSGDEISDAINKFNNSDRIFIDSLSALSAASAGGPQYRIYISQLFEFFQKIKATTFLVSETEQYPTAFSRSGVEEFLADGVIVMYNLPHKGIVERAIEIRKFRGAEHSLKIVQLQITSKEGISVFPQQTVYYKNSINY